MKKLQFRILLLLLTLAFAPVAGQWHWESIVLESDQFRYLVPEQEPSVDWMQTQFDDSAWPNGNGGFGYEDGDDQTIVQATTSVYLRKEITVPAGLDIRQLLLDIDYDDAFVAYLNGNEIARSDNLLDGVPAISGSVIVDHEARMYSGGKPERFLLNPVILSEGSNLLAVHIMNMSLTSSDLSARIFLSAELNADHIIFNQPPDWFNEQVSFGSSNLPIVKINTQGQSIPNEPKITALMKIIDNPSGVNFTFDTTYTYDGYVGIEIRGNTAQMFPKKSYTVETRLSTGENNNVPLLGLPVENDWVLHGPYSDKSLMRNVLAYNIGNAMNNGWHPHTRYVELEINGEYRGVYLAVEKIKIDKNRVDIADLRPEDIDGDELTGGYIISIDRDQLGGWNSPFMGRTGSVDVPFSYIDPGYKDLTPEQRDYIRRYITDFEYALDGDDFRDPEIGYRAYIDVISFIDYFIITELSKDLDGYRVSVFMHKDKDSKGGKLSMTPFWDYNICFGNANFFAAGNPSGWASDGIGVGDAYEIPFWWDKLRSDPYFETMLKYRWEELRQSAINLGRLNRVIDSCATLLSDAQARNFETFNILSSYVWPNNYVGGTYENEVNYLKEWFSTRMQWMDSQIDAIETIDISRPIVSTAAAANITNITAILGGYVSNEGGSPVTERGLYWDSVPEPGKAGVKVMLGSGEGNYISTISGLIPDTRYYVQAYATNDLGTSYGNEVNFITTNVKSTPAVATGEILEITDNSAYPTGTVISDGGATVTGKGFYYGTQPSPELNGTKVEIGNGVGNFIASLTGLSSATNYYVKAYAINEAGIGYGAEYNFTTLTGNVGVEYGLQEGIEPVIAFPNPFSESLTIGVNLDLPGSVKLVVTNMLGEVVFMKVRECSSGFNQFFFVEDDFSARANLFFYTVIVDDQVLKSGKVLKQ